MFSSIERCSFMRLYNYLYIIIIIITLFYNPQSLRAL